MVLNVKIVYLSEKQAHHLVFQITLSDMIVKIKNYYQEKCNIAQIDYEKPRGDGSPRGALWFGWI